MIQFSEWLKHRDPQLFEALGDSISRRNFLGKALGAVGAGLGGIAAGQEGERKASSLEKLQNIMKDEPIRQKAFQAVSGMPEEPKGKPKEPKLDSWDAIVEFWKKPTKGTRTANNIWRLPGADPMDLQKWYNNFSKAAAKDKEAGEEEHEGRKNIMKFITVEMIYRLDDNSKMKLNFGNHPLGTFAAHHNTLHSRNNYDTQERKKNQLKLVKINPDNSITVKDIHADVNPVDLLKSLMR